MIEYNAFALMALVLFAFIAMLLFLGIAEVLQKRLDAYRNKYGFDKEVERSVMTTKDINKQNKRLAFIEKRYNERVKAQLPRQENESLIRFIIRKLKA